MFKNEVHAEEFTVDARTPDTVERDDEPGMPYWSREKGREPNTRDRHRPPYEA